MDAFFASAGLVALAEMGDKTQLLALLLSTRYRRPLSIILGILVATLANHALAAWAGASVAAWLGGDMLRWILAASFFVMAGWCLVPDPPGAAPRTADRAGAFLATVIAFFLVEIGDKTQLATVALAGRFPQWLVVTVGTTAGMMAANVPAVLFGDLLSRTVPLRLVRAVAAASFAVLGALTLMLDGLL